MDNPELTELIEKLGLQNHSYTFSVVTLDSENYVTGSYIESADDLEEQGILSQFDGDFCQTDNIPAGGFNQMYGGNILCEFRIDVISICALKGVRV